MTKLIKSLNMTADTDARRIAVAGAFTIEGDPVNVTTHAASADKAAIARFNRSEASLSGGWLRKCGEWRDMPLFEIVAND